MTKQFNTLQRVQILQAFLFDIQSSSMDEINDQPKHVQAIGFMTMSILQSRPVKIPTECADIVDMMRHSTLWRGLATQEKLSNVDTDKLKAFARAPMIIDMSRWSSSADTPTTSHDTHSLEIHTNGDYVSMKLEDKLDGQSIEMAAEVSTLINSEQVTPSFNVYGVSDECLMIIQRSNEGLQVHQTQSNTFVMMPDAKNLDDDATIAPR